MSRTYHTSTKIYRTNRSLVWLSVVLLGISPTSAFAQTISVYPDSRSNSPAPPGNTVTNQSTITTSSSNTSSSTAFQIGDGSAKPSRQAAVSKATQLDAATPKKLEDGTTDSAGTNRTDSVTADKADSPPPLSDNQADTKPASPTPVDINANTPSKLDTIEVSAHQPQWKTTLSDGNETFLRVLEAISGRPNNEETCSLLKGVVKITKLENKFEFLRQDEEALELDASTKLGSNMLRVLEKAQQDSDKYCEKLGQVISGFKAVQVTGNHIEVVRDGQEDATLHVGVGGGKSMPFKLKEVQIGRISMDLLEDKGILSLRNITGLEAVVVAGLSWNVTLKEFWRTRNENSDTIVTFGILNPIPKPLRFAFGMGHIHYFSHTIKKKH